jgi:hypothetical protein
MTDQINTGTLMVDDTRDLTDNTDDAHGFTHALLLLENITDFIK